MKEGRCRVGGLAIAGVPDSDDVTYEIPTSSAAPARW
jgi:hypothetical protein